MRLVTIWSIHYMPMTERLRRTVDWGAMTTARKLPKRIRYWATVTEIAKATRNNPNIPETTLDKVLKGLDGGSNWD